MFSRTTLLLFVASQTLHDVLQEANLPIRSSQCCWVQACLSAVWLALYWTTQFQVRYSTVHGRLCHCLVRERYYTRDKLYKKLSCCKATVRLLRGSVLADILRKL